MGLIKSKPKFKREFTGNIDSKTATNFDKADLKVYIGGHKFFHHGYYTDKQGARQRMLHRTSERLTEIEYPKF